MFEQDLRLEIDFVVGLGADPVPRLLSVLAHQDDRSLHGGDARENQVEQDKGVRVPVTEGSDGIHRHPDGEEQQEDDDEGPATGRAREPIGRSLPESSAFGRLKDVGVTAGTVAKKHRYVLLETVERSLGDR